MAFIKKETQKFDKEKIGSFGDFETSTSYELNYLMTTLDISDIEDLSSASDVLSFDDTKFEELIQRDIDYDRVDKQIVKNYLEQGKDKAIFFPPMLVTPMVVKDGKPLERFEEKDIKEDKDELIINWDNQMELLFPIYGEADDNYPYRIQNKEGEKVAIHNYATTLKYKSKSVKLVVIDGQHRFMALKRIWDNENKRDLIRNIKIPLCIFFTPNAVKKKDDNVKKDDSTNTLTKSMRQLFVTINSTAKQVSGHFIVLLSDDALSSYAVRDIANYWKDNNRLFFLEWNEREDRRASQINKKYSITTVKILDTVLKDKLFKKGRTEDILKLSDVSKGWIDNCAEEDLLDIYDISDDNFSQCMVADIEEQIKLKLTPCIDLLFFEPRPYVERKEQFYKAFESLEKQIGKNIEGAKYFRNSVLLQFRETSNYDSDASKDIEKEFLAKFSTIPEDEFYFKNIFQQSYMTAWLEFYVDNDLEKYVTLQEYTSNFIESMNLICFDSSKQLFLPSREYTQSVFYNNARILVNSTSRKELSSLIISTFLNNKVLAKFLAKIQDSVELKKKIEIYANKKIQVYFEAFRKNTFSEIKKNWKTQLDTDSSFYSKLISMEKDIGTKEGKKKFDDELNIYVENKYEKAKKIFYNVIETNEDNTF